MTQVQSNQSTEIATAISQGKRGTQPLKLLWIVLGLRSSLFLAELITGLWIRSLSLLAVSGHLLVDVLVIGVALIAAKLANRSPETEADDEIKLAPKRVEAWAALINGLILIGIAALIFWGAIAHFQTLAPNSGLPMLVMAAFGLALKGISASLLYKDSHHNLNLRGVFLHAIADAASSASLILAALAVLYLGWLWADAAASLLVAIFMSLSALLLLRDSWQILSQESI